MDGLHSADWASLLAEHRRRWPGRTALVDGEVRLSYPDLADRVLRLAGGLAALGTGAGDRVLWLGQNSFRLAETLLACGRLGAMCCPANWRGSPEELAFVLDDLEPKAVVWQDEEIGERARAARAAARGGAEWIRHDASGPGSYEALVAGAEPVSEDAPVDPGAPLLLLYTAAFGGRPAAAMLGHTALLTQATLWASLIDADEEYVFLNCGAMYHIANWWWTLATLAVGGTNVFTRRVDADELCRLIETERCTGAHVLGPTHDQIIEAQARRGYDLSSLRATRGRPEWDALTAPDESRWGAAPGGYGQTELVGMTTWNVFGRGATGLHGRSAPLVQVRIVDPDDQEVAVGEVGEIVVRGPTVMNGYWNRPEETAQRFRNGWHHTHDLGRREPDGSITFVGPATRMLKSAAENIYPVEVERCIAEHPAVRECAVIGVPDEVWVQSVKAIVVLEDGAHVTADEIVEHCRSRLASYKKPRSVAFVGALPRAGFAVDYDALDAQFGGGGYPGGRTRSA
jgi:acyl-CoA synthetase (AMP-forming)/AMP-acid ligase II